VIENLRVLKNMKAIVQAFLKSAGYEIRRIRKGDQGDVSIHFLHIGKNAGTQVSNISSQLHALPTKRKIIKQNHDVFLKNIPERDDYFFSIRNPISRFKSGFYSRKRKGQRRIYAEWSAHDELSFSEFEHANDLAESLFETGEYGRKAWGSMKSIRHTAQNQSDWFYSCGNFLRVRPPIWIIRQESFEKDIRKFIFLAFPDVNLSDIDFSVDHISSHANNYSSIPPLSKKANENLTAWYAQDLSFYDMCNDWIEKEGRFC
jgi:hypothetical protein